MGKYVHSSRFIFAAVIMAGLGGALIWGNLNLSTASSSVKPARNPNTRNNIQDMILEAAEAEKNGRLPEAIGIYEKILAQDPQAAVVYLKLGQIYFRMGLPTKSEEAYLKAIGYGLNDPDVFLFLGYIKESQSKLDLALEYYSKAELAASRNPVLYFNMGNVHAQLGHADQALTYFKRAVVLNPDYMDAFVNLSIVSAQAGEYFDAQYYLEKAEKLGYHAPVQYKEGLAAKVKEPLKK